MIIRKDKTESIRKFSLFGWNIYITRDKLRRKDPHRARFRTTCKKQRLIMAGNRCELCGDPITISCTLHHMLPKGCDKRNEVDNIRVICPSCARHVQRIGVFRPMITNNTEGGDK